MNVIKYCGNCNFTLIQETVKDLRGINTMSTKQTTLEILDKLGLQKVGKNWFLTVSNDERQVKERKEDHGTV